MVPKSMRTLVLLVLGSFMAHTSGDQATLRAGGRDAVNTASPGDQMMGLIDNVRMSLEGERTEAEKTTVLRQTQCKKQEDALAFSLKQYQQALNDLAQDQDHKNVAMGSLKRAVENNHDLTRHLSEEREGIQGAEADDVDAFELATLVRETAAGANREHVNRNRMYAKTTMDLLSIVQRHFTGVSEERNFGAHDIVRVSSVDTGKHASLIETESKNATAPAGSSAGLGVPIEAFAWRDAEAHAIYQRMQDLLHHVSTGMDKENAVEFQAAAAFKQARAKRNVDRLKRVAMNRTVAVDINAAHEENVKSSIDLDLAIARDSARPARVNDATHAIEQMKEMIKLTRKTCEEQDAQDAIAAQLRAKQLNFAGEAMTTVSAQMQGVKDLVAKYAPK